jgi:hypothetical protein
LFDFLNQIKKIVSVAIMPMHLVVLECKTVSKMRLGAVQTLPRIFRIFLEFILIFLELFLLIRRL